MALSRKSRRSLKKLRGEAGDLWSEQRDVLEHASAVLREASRQASEVAKRDVAPQVKSTYEKRVQPGVDAGLGAVRTAADTTRHTWSRAVLPAVTGAIGATLAVIDVARDNGRDALREASRTGRDFATRAGQRIGVVEVKATPGPGRYIAVALGVLAVTAVAYAAYQTLRADDDLWVEDEPIETAVA
jgi:hypothetical protein